MLMLSNFVRSECANYRNGGCAMNKNGCPVLKNERCAVEAKSVIPTDNVGDYFAVAVAPVYVHKPEFTDAAIEYGRILNRSPDAKTIKVNERNCECGAPLGKRQRCCDECKKKRLNLSKRKWRESAR